jgi:hypothetical protein
MRRVVLAALTAAAMSDPAWSQEPPPAPDAPSQGLFSQEAIDRELVAARSWLELSLTDYETARFRDVRLVLLSPDRRNRSKVVLGVCGMANARNRMGGYTGFKAFYFASAIPGYGRSDFGVFAPEICARANRLNPIDYTDRLAAGDAQ